MTRQFGAVGRSVYEKKKITPTDFFSYPEKLESVGRLVEKMLGDHCVFLRTMTPYTTNCL